MVNIAMEYADMSTCPAGDPSGDQTVTVNEIVMAVNNALTGCAPPVSPTPSTPGRIAGGVTVVVNTVGAIPSVIGAIASGMTLKNPAATLLEADEVEPHGGTAGVTNCPLGGTVTTGSTLFSVTVELDNCKLPNATGTVTYDGSAALNLATTSFTADLTAIYAAGSVETRRLSAVLQGTASPTLGGACYLSAATLTIATGTLAVSTPNGEEAGVGLTNASVAIQVDTFSSDCVPTVYRMTLNGAAQLSITGAVPVDVVFDTYRMNVDDTGDPLRLAIDGALTAACYGGRATVLSNPTLLLPEASICPTTGGLDLTLPSGHARVVFLADGRIEVDKDGNGTTDQTLPRCLAAAMLQCG